MSYSIKNELTVVEQIEKTGHATIAIDVNGCYESICNMDTVSLKVMQ